MRAEKRHTGCKEAIGQNMDTDINNNQNDILKSIEGGTLLWMRTNQHFGIEVPLNILTKEQRSSLEEYLRQEDQVCDNSNRSRLVWEYYLPTIHPLIVQVFELTKEQKLLLDPPKPKLKKPEYTYSNTDIVALKNMFNDNRINWQEVVSILQNISGRPWSTKTWKEKRDKLIGDTCKLCGTKKGIMVLQHTKQPRKPRTIMLEYERSYWKELKEWIYSKPIIPDVSKYPKDANACPRCNSQVIRYRKAKETWICVGVENGVKCGHVFDVPEKVVSKWITRDLEKQEIEDRKINFLDQRGFGKRIATEALDGLIDYLAMKNVITLCKSCAFIADKTELVLCQYCKSKYHKKGIIVVRDAQENRLMQFRTYPTSIKRDMEGIYHRANSHHQQKCLLQAQNRL